MRYVLIGSIVLWWSSPVFALPDLLVSSRLNDQVLRYDANGNFVGVAAAGNGLNRPNGLAFGSGSDADTLFVASRDGNQILKYAIDSGAFLGVFAEGPEMAGPSDITFGPNGDLYVCNSLADNVARYDRQTGALKNLYTDPDLQHPVGVAFSAAGELFVSSVTARRLYQLDPSTSQVLGVVAENGLLSGPADIVFGPDGRLYAANPPGNSLTRFNTSTGTVSNFTVGATLANPTSMQWGDDGRWYVGSFSGDKVLAITAAGVVAGNHIAPAAGALDGPQYILFVPEPSASLLGLLGITLCRRRKP